MSKIIKIHLQQGSYNIYLEDGLISKIHRYLKDLSLGNYCIILTNRKVYRLYKNALRKICKNMPHTIVRLPDSERTKSRQWVFHIMHQVLKHDTLRRRVFIACVGGGVIGDLGGFVASVYRRGIPYVQIPTTLLAQVDASIGGKTAIDFSGVKNIIGAYYQPKAVFIDPQFLKTLSPGHVRQGIAEAIKYGVIKDKALFRLLEVHYEDVKRLQPPYSTKIIYQCAQIKARIVEKDERERKGLRTILNFGHTVAHALEGSYEFRRLSHGEAVAIGMLAAADISLHLGICQKKDVAALRNIIRLYSFPTQLQFDADKFLRSLMYDKKFIRGTIRMVLMRTIGKVTVIEGVPLRSIKKSLKNITHHTP